MTSRNTFITITLVSLAFYAAMTGLTKWVRGMQASVTVPSIKGASEVPFIGSPSPVREKFDSASSDVQNCIEVCDARAIALIKSSDKNEGTADGLAVLISCCTIVGVGVLLLAKIGDKNEASKTSADIVAVVAACLQVALTIVVITPYKESAQSSKKAYELLQSSNDAISELKIYNEKFTQSETDSLRNQKENGLVLELLATETENLANRLRRL